MMSAHVFVLALAAMASERWGDLEVVGDDCLVQRHRLDWVLLRRATELEDADNTRTGDVRVELGCTERGVALTLVRDAAAVEQRTVELDGVDPSVRERVLALAIVELVDGSSSSPPSAPPPLVAVRSPPPRPRRWQLDLGPSVRWFAQQGSVIAGAELGVVHRPLAQLSWRVAIAAEGGRAAHDLGIVRLASLSGAIHVFGHGTLGPVVLYAGPGVRLGWGHLRGRPGERASVSGRAFDTLWLGPAGTAGIDVRFGPRFVLGAAIEAGYAAVGARAQADDAQAPGLARTWVAGRVTAGIRL